MLNRIASLLRRNQPAKTPSVGRHAGGGIYFSEDSVHCHGRLVWLPGPAYIDAEPFISLSGSDIAGSAEAVLRILATHPQAVSNEEWYSKEWHAERAKRSLKALGVRSWKSAVGRYRHLDFAVAASGDILLGMSRRDGTSYIGISGISELQIPACRTAGELEPHLLAAMSRCE